MYRDNNEFPPRYHGIILLIYGFPIQMSRQAPELDERVENGDNRSILLHFHTVCGDYILLLELYVGKKSNVFGLLLRSSYRTYIDCIMTRIHRQEEFRTTSNI